MVSLSPYLKYKKKEQGGVATNLERAGIGMGMGMGIEYGKPAPRFEQRKRSRTGGPPS